MKTRILGYVLVMLVFLLAPTVTTIQAQENDADGINRLIILKRALPTSKASGFAKLFYKDGKTPYQRLQVVAVGLKPDTEYQLFVNGVAMDIRKSNDTGSVEFLFGTNNKLRLLEGDLNLPADISSVLSVQNISIRERDLSVALLGDMNAQIEADNQTGDVQVLSIMNNMTMEAGKTLTLLVPLSDPDGDPVTLTVSCDKGNFIGVNGMSMVMSPTNADVGTHICASKVTDSFGLFTTIPFVVNVTPANKPPVLNPIADMVIKTGEVRDLTLQASDPDGNAGLRFQITQGPAYMLLSDRGDGTAILRIAPQPSDTLGGIATVRVIDAGGLTAQSSFTITLTQSVTITSVTRAKPNVFISGTGFGSSNAIVNINGQDVTNRMIGQSDTSITLKGGAKRLNLRKGANQIIVTVAGVSSNTYVLNMLDEE